MPNLDNILTSSYKHFQYHALYVLKRMLLAMLSAFAIKQNLAPAAWHCVISTAIEVRSYSRRVSIIPQLCGLQQAPWSVFLFRTPRCRCIFQYETSRIVISCVSGLTPFPQRGAQAAARLSTIRSKKQAPAKTNEACGVEVSKQGAWNEGRFSRQRQENM